MNKTTKTTKVDVKEALAKLDTVDLKKVTGGYAARGHFAIGHQMRN